MPVEQVVVVGAGLAAGKAVEAMRESGYDGSITVYGAEPHPPYERPPLSKGYLLGNDPLESAFVHERQWYVDNDITLRLGTPVDTIDLPDKTVIAGSQTQHFDKLLLATGATPRHLAMADESGAPIAYLRTIEDSDMLRAAFKPGARVAVIGAGWIGLEATSAARNADAEVIVIEPLAAPLLRVLGPEVATIFANLHREHGVDLRLEQSTAKIERADPGANLTLADGTAVRADVIVVGIGVTPNVRLAESAGLAVDNGVLVDEQLRTSHPDVYAVGDIANQQHPVLGRRVRVEHWDTAINQGIAAAKNLLGADQAYDTLPYFFSDQYDFGMEYVGAIGPDGYDDVVVTGDPDAFVFNAFWRKGGRVIAAMHGNDWDRIDDVRNAVSSGELP